MHAGRYQETPASSGYKSQRRNRTKKAKKNRGEEGEAQGEKRDREGEKENTENKKEIEGDMKDNWAA